MKRNYPKTLLATLLLLCSTVASTQEISYHFTTTNCTDSGHNLIWNSDLIEFNSPTNGLRITMFENNSGAGTNEFNGFPIIALGELEFYDGDGNKISDTYIKMPKQYTELKYGDTLPLGLYQFFMMRVPGELDEGCSFLMDLGGGNHYPLHIYSPLMCDSGYGFNRIKFSFNASPSAPGYIFNTVEYSTIAASGTSYGLNFKEVEDSDTFAIYYNKLTI